MARDYYETLEVPRDATPEAIKKAYRKLARKHHPDVNPGDKKAEANFKETQQAYDILSDAEKRALYDRYGTAAFEGMAAAGPRAGGSEWAGQHGAPNFEGFDFNDLLSGAAGPGAGPEAGGGGLFEELLGRMRGGRGAGGRRSSAGVGPRPGQTFETTMSVPFLTAVRGGETEVRLERDGKTEPKVVKIPAGIDSGAKIRLRGQGGPGQRGGPDGDLIIEVNVEPHPYFVRDGRNLTVEVPVTIPEAVLGGKIEVPTLDGPRALPVPAGSSSGQKLRLRGQGLPASGGKPEGDLFVILRIVAPKGVDEESRALIREFGERNPARPRDGLW